MIRPRGFRGIAFGEASDGDPRRDHVVRAEMSAGLGIPSSWAIVDQVHGTHVVVADSPGHFGEADAILTMAPMLPIAIATADCVPVVLVGRESIAVVHAGWRGVAAGVVGEAVRLITEKGDSVSGAVIGPHIGSCCYEVGPEVVEALGGYERTTRSEKRSVDLAGAIGDQLPDIVIEVEFGCTMHNDRFHSFRRNATLKRQVTVAWIPQD